MTKEPYASAPRVFWVVDNGSDHRGKASIKRLQGRWPTLILMHLSVHASWLNQVEIYSIVQRKLLEPNEPTWSAPRYATGQESGRTCRVAERKGGTHRARAALRQLVLGAIRAQAGEHPGEDAERRRELTAQLERLRDLYVMGDITKPMYVMQRQVLEEELHRAKPPTDPDLNCARAILDDFTRFWDAEPEPGERRKLLLWLFAQIWAKDDKIVAVEPNTAFANYFTAASEVRATH